MYETIPKGVVFFSVLFIVVLSVSFDKVLAEEISNTTVASPVAVEGDVRDGDIVSHDAVNETYRQSDVYADESMFGVMIEDPILYMTDGEVPEGAYPVVRSGEAFVNVSTLGGEIRPGDLITTSRIQGYGVRADRDSVTYVLGFALEPMVPSADVEAIVVNEVEVTFGRVRVALRLGPHVPGDLDDEIAILASSSVATQVLDEEVGNSFDSFKAFRFLLGAFVALAAIFFALRRFGATFTESVISVGRNPLARSQVRSVLIWNAFLIILISGVGIAFGVAIILLP